RPPGRPRWGASRSRSATSSPPSSAPPTVTRDTSRIRIASTSTAAPTTTCPSASAVTSASATTWRSSRPGSRWGRCSIVCPGSASIPLPRHLASRDSPSARPSRCACGFKSARSRSHALAQGREDGAWGGDDCLRMHGIREDNEGDELGGDGGVHAVAGQAGDLQEHTPAVAGLACQVSGEARYDDLRIPQRARTLVPEGALEDGLAVEHAAEGLAVHREALQRDGPHLLRGEAASRTGGRGLAGAEQRHRPAPEGELRRAGAEGCRAAL